MKGNLGVGMVFALLVGVGAAAWWLLLRPEPQADPAPLGELPLAVDGWRGEELPLDSTVESMLEATFNVQRAYRRGADREAGHPVWLYVGYYSTERGGTPEHTPRVCYDSAGWRILERQVVDVDPAGDLRANQLIVVRGGEARLVFYWYRSFRDTGILDTARLELDHALGRLLERRGDGALIRLSTPIIPPGADGVDPARRRLADFALRLEPLLGEHWPRETLAP